MTKPLCRARVDRGGAVHLCFGDKEIVARGVILDEFSMYKGVAYIDLKILQDINPNCRLHVTLVLGETTPEYVMKHLPGYNATAEILDFPESARCIKCEVKGQ